MIGRPRRSYPVIFWVTFCNVPRSPPGPSLAIWPTTSVRLSPAAVLFAKTPPSSVALIGSILLIIVPLTPVFSATVDATLLRSPEPKILLTRDVPGSSAAGPAKREGLENFPLVMRIEIPNPSLPA